MANAIRRWLGFEERPQRLMLFRWHRHWQLDIRLQRGFLCLGTNWRDRYQLIAYWSPDATPMHRLARGLGAEPQR